MVETTIRATLVEGKTVCLLSSSAFFVCIDCSIHSTTSAGSSVAQRSGGWVESGGSLLLAGL